MKHEGNTNSLKLSAAENHPHIFNWYNVHQNPDQLMTKIYFISQMKFTNKKSG